MSGVEVGSAGESAEVWEAGEMWDMVEVRLVE